MNRLLRAGFALASLTAATSALAIDTSFHTYDGFAETVDAFRLVSMIFADPRYTTLVLLVGVVGIALGAVIASVRGQGMGLVAFGFQMLVGVGLFVGLIATTGTVHVYDRVRNAYQPVGSVPNLIVLVAGVTNLMERSLAETIDDNTLDPNAKLEMGAGGHSFDLFLNAVPSSRLPSDQRLDARNSIATGRSRHTLHRGISRVHGSPMSKGNGNIATRTPAAAPFTRRGVTVLPPAVPPKASFTRIQKAVKAAARKHAELVAG